jgi:hypothetical protein
MSVCSFSLPISISPELALEKARKSVESQGGQFDGDLQAGSFSLHFFGNTVAGHYTLSDGALHMTITEKPTMIPCSAIESYLKNKLN